MKLQTIFAHSAWSPHAAWPWGFLVLVLLIVFITLVVSEGSTGKDK
jgi:hypothetical protein